MNDLAHSEKPDLPNFKLKWYLSKKKPPHALSKVKLPDHFPVFIGFV